MITKINGKVISRKKLLENEFYRIQQLIESAKSGDHRAAEEILFQIIGYFRESDKRCSKIAKILQEYLGECLSDCILEPLSIPSTMHKFFGNMNDADRAVALYKALHLNRPSCKPEMAVSKKYMITRQYLI